MRSWIGCGDQYFRSLQIAASISEYQQVWFSNSYSVPIRNNYSDMSF